MRLLALDSSTEACSVAYYDNGSVHEIFDVIGRGHAEHLLQMIDRLLAECQVTLSAVDTLAFGAGPGSFTGLRIGAAMAQGLALAGDRPVVAVSSLQALAAAQQGTVLALIDARMEQVYQALYRTSPGEIPVLLEGESVCAPGDLLLPSAQQLIIVGTGWDRYRAEIESRQPADAILQGIAGQYPHAGDIAALGAHAAQAGQATAAEQALPHYVRNDVARKMSD
jgi:tRNA threonylcarbamoyladenosine biosynthesis protein TsaB